MGKRKKQQKSRNEIPQEFYERLEKICPNPSDFQIIKSTFVERPTTFRINTIKADPASTILSLKKQGFKLKETTWSPIAFSLQNRSKKDLMETQEYLEGQIYIQSFASQIPPIVLEPKAGETVLDLTAAPGSKTSQIAALMEQKGNLTAVELNKPRFFKLQHNLVHLGLSEEFVQTHLSDGSYFAKQNPETFDKILLDAPCSAEARFCEAKPKTYAYWSRHKIKEMQSKQRRLLYAAWTALKPGGILVYSTCTLAPEENEVQINKMLEKFEDCQIEEINLANFPQLTPVLKWNEKDLNPELSKTLRIKPTKEVEGFFVAKLKKLPN